MQLQKIFLQILYTNRPYACIQTMLTEFNFQSATRVENTIVCYYIHAILHTFAMSACSMVLSIFIMKCMLKLPYLSLTSQFSTFLKDLLARRNLCTAASRASRVSASSIGFIMIKHEMEFSVLSVFCHGGIATYVLMVSYGYRFVIAMC